MISNYTGVSGSRIAYLAAAELKEHRKILIVVSSGRVAQRLSDDLAFFAPEADIIVMPQEENSLSYEARDKTSLKNRLKGIQALATPKDSSKMVAVIAPVSAVLKPTVSSEHFNDALIKLEVSDVVDTSELKRRLAMSGYEAQNVTESTGEFSSRGGLIDVFSASYDNPLRIEFFDDEIDSIRFYDVDTQRSVLNVKDVLIGPAAEFIPSSEELEEALKHKDIPDELRERFETRTDIQLYADYLNYFNLPKTFLWEIFDDARIVVCDPERVISEIPDFQNEKEYFGIYQKDVVIYTPMPERLKGVSRLDHVINMRSRQVASFGGNMELFTKDIANMLAAGYSIKIVSSSKDREDRIKEYLSIADIHGDITNVVGALSSGFILDDGMLCYIAESDIFPQSKRKPLKRKKKSANSINFSDLKAGDYVVHEIHGIGRFEGIKTLTADGETKDYLQIRYAGTDLLYIPTEQLDIIQKYIGSHGEAPSLSRLSGGAWKRTRDKVRKAIEEIAEDLVKLYAQRESAPGHAFPKDSFWQGQFEEDFPYTETEDQLRAIDEIKEDMQKPVPMDRLLCGDVGFGKTEVAARAIFKCISEGKQAAVLAPTTLLANQHYHNLLARFEGYPFEIEMLSRFRTATQQKEIIRKLKEGKIDLLIGTHRLLSNDVEYKDLGLLVIDEEQRFGVKHKEALKMIKQDVDVLTLSATPIPRTLNMSLTGIKDISTIDEPPGDRVPVQTFVTSEDDNLICNILERELSRGGQAFIVDNRISGVKDIAERVQRMLPDIRVAIGHGRMSEEDLENTMLDYVEGRIDVLVATTIIENGIDIPNANTIIILNADRLGLAQLYQLRGRVGRSSRIAYAYLMYKPQKVLTDVARKRLIAIREFTEFGAGFKIAMRDLELRGAGNVLGEAQSGHIEGIGYELYCKEIDRAVRRLKGETVTEERAEISIEINLPSNIPASYIDDETLRLQAYKKIATISGEDDAEELIDELIDRYGDIPDTTSNLIKIAEIRAHAEVIGVSNIFNRGERFTLNFAKVNNVSAYMLVVAKEEFKDTLTIMSGNNPGLSLYIGKQLDLTQLLSLMRTLRYNYELEKKANLV